MFFKKKKTVLKYPLLAVFVQISSIMSHDHFRYDRDYRVSYFINYSVTCSMQIFL